MTRASNEITVYACDVEDNERLGGDGDGGTWPERVEGGA